MLGELDSKTFVCVHVCTYSCVCNGGSGGREVHMHTVPEVGFMYFLQSFYTLHFETGSPSKQNLLIQLGTGNQAPLDPISAAHQPDAGVTQACLPYLICHMGVGDQI